MRIYVASSWRNEEQPKVVARLRAEGHEVYDFKNPDPHTGFSWSEIDPGWRLWTPEAFREALDHPRAVEGFDSDMNALRACDACICVMPCGRSAHLELGWAVGERKRTAVLLHEDRNTPGHVYDPKKCAPYEMNDRHMSDRCVHGVEVSPKSMEPELMYKMLDAVCTTLDEVVEFAASPRLCKWCLTNPVSPGVRGALYCSPECAWSGYTRAVSP